MKAAFSTIFQLIFLTVTVYEARAQSPPQLLQNYGISQRIVRPRTSTTLPCPVRGSKDSIIFEWYKDKESLMSFGGPRVRITNNGSLRIKETIFDDTGLYTCKAVNGFGSVEYNTTLLVIGEDEDYEQDEEYEDDDEFGIEEDSATKMSLASKPRILYVKQGDSPIHLTPGSALKLQCVATGRPRPDILWYKGNHQVPRTLRRGRWTIKFNSLQISDSGNYTCIANNVLGSASRSFVLNVDDSVINSRGIPTLIGSEPSNTTVEVGQMAVMQCAVKSSTYPHIEWLKRVEKSDLNEDEIRNSLKMEGEIFRALSSSEVVDRKDGTYYNKLVIDVAQVSDAGKYVCLGANTFGYSFRSAYLMVIPRKHGSGMSSSSSSIPFPIVVAMTVVAVAAMAGVFAFLVYCRSRERTGSRSSSTAVPMVTKDTLLPMHPGPNNSHRCTIEPSRGRSKHQTTVYVPAGTTNAVF